MNSLFLCTEGHLPERSLTEGEFIPQMVRMKRGAWSDRSTRRQGLWRCQSTCATSKPAPSFSALPRSSSSSSTTPSWSFPTSTWPGGPASRILLFGTNALKRRPVSNPTSLLETGTAVWWWCPTLQLHLLFRFVFVCWIFCQIWTHLLSFTPTRVKMLFLWHICDKGWVREAWCERYTCTYTHKHRVIVVSTDEAHSGSE